MRQMTWERNGASMSYRHIPGPKETRMIVLARLSHQIMRGTGSFAAVSESTGSVYSSNENEISHR
jgi:hypothetical protein